MNQHHNSGGKGGALSGFTRIEPAPPLSPSERTVWMVRVVDKDTSAAAAHGVLKTCFPRSVSAMNVQEQIRIIEATVLPNAKPEDLILLAGPSMMQGTLITIFARVFDRVHMLMFDSKQERYVERTV